MKLSKDLATEWWMDNLEGQLDAERKLQLDAYLKENPELATELLETICSQCHVNTWRFDKPNHSKT